MKNPTGTIRFASSATQNHPFPSPGIAPAEKSGNTSPGPILSGAVARARMVAREPRTWAAMRVKRTWKRVRVWRRIIPKPMKRQLSCPKTYNWARIKGEQVELEVGENVPTPCKASKHPNHSQRLLPATALAMGPPAHGTYCPMLLVPHSICAHRGAPSPMAKTGRIQEWEVDK